MVTVVVVVLLGAVVLCVVLDACGLVLLWLALAPTDDWSGLVLDGEVAEGLLLAAEPATPPLTGGI